MEAFIKSAEWAGLQKSAEVMGVQLTLDSTTGFINIKKNTSTTYRVHKMLPDWTAMDLGYWVPVIFKSMAIVNEVKDV
jgi:hypothetical protein